MKDNFNDSTIDDILLVISDLRVIKFDNSDLPLEMVNKINQAINDLTFIIPYLT